MIKINFCGHDIGLDDEHCTEGFTLIYTDEEILDRMSLVTIRDYLQKRFDNLSNE